MKSNLSIFELSEDVGFQMAPMIDVVFLLIIFFMVAANVTTGERIPIEVPLADRAVVAKDPSNRINVTLTEDGTLFAGSAQVSDEAFAERVAVLARENPGLRVFLRADGGLRHERVREIMAILGAAGISDLIFATYQSHQ